MKVIAPASVCIGLPAELRQKLWIIPQKVKVGAEAFYIDKQRLEDLALKQGQLGRFIPVPLGEIVRRFEKLDSTANLVLLTPSAAFDTTPYGNLITSVLPGNTRIYPCTFNAYGNALTFLLQGTLRFIEQATPTPAQLKLFVDRLNDATHAFLLTSRAQQFEPKLSWLVAQWHKLTQQTTVYEATDLQWQRSHIKQITKVIRLSGAAQTLVFIDSYQANHHAKQGRHYLRDKSFDQKRLIQKPLHYASNSLPATFAMLTTIPTKAQIEEFAQWALHWQQ